MTGERVYVGIQDKIKGLPTIKQCKVLANRRNILTKYSNGTIAMFDVFTGEKGKALYLRYDYPVRIEAVRSNSVRSKRNVKAWSSWSFWIDRLGRMFEAMWTATLCSKLVFRWVIQSSFISWVPARVLHRKNMFAKNRSRTAGTLGISIGWYENNFHTMKLEWPKAFI